MLLLLLGVVLVFSEAYSFGLGILGMGLGLMQIGSILSSRESLIQVSKVNKQIRSTRSPENADDLALIELALQGLENAINDQQELLSTSKESYHDNSPKRQVPKFGSGPGFLDLFSKHVNSGTRTLVVTSQRLVRDVRENLGGAVNGYVRLVTYDCGKPLQLNDIMQFEKLLIWVDPRTDREGLERFIPYAWTGPDTEIVAGPNPNSISEFVSLTNLGTEVRPLIAQVVDDRYFHVAFQRSLEN